MYNSDGRIFFMKKHTFEPVNPHINFPEMEDVIIQYWKKNKIFERSVDERPDTKTWTFLDGPPFITGLPHYGTLLSSIPKDLFPRYFTMKGYKVRRVWGWDCHGLPAENKVESTLGIKRKKDIEEKVGIKKFIDACKTYVNNVSGEWEWYVDHIGRWVDFTHAYKTMDMSYMETVMWVFKQMYEKGCIYKGLRVSLYCPHCSTPISNFEVAMDADNYKEIEEPATTYKYVLKGEENTYILAWSTTPWNKIATPALAVNPKLDYVKVKQGNEYYILAQSTLSKLDERPYMIEKRYKGIDLIGKEFELHYTFYPVEKGKRAGVIIGGDFVTADEGTGVVTIAAYGEEDLAVMQKENIQIVQHVDDEGIMKADVPKWAGMYYLDVNPLVDEDLKSRGLVYKEEKILHTVPTCWRCHTRLIFAPQDAWYVNIQDLKNKLIQTNKSVNWFPGYFKEGRYQKSIESAPDWCISRSRYWGSPVPVWECECGEQFVPGSIAELEKASGVKISDLHKPVIDDVTVPCKKCGKKSHRVSEVLDSWIEAGSASFAERHFPFDTTVPLEKFFPPDFVTEYTGQIRAWFYVLHVIATALYDSAAFKNVAVSGVVLGTDGRKMSKNYGNYPDPKELIQKYGGDALRLYLMGSPVMHGEDIRISEEQYRMQIRGFLLILWNIYNFFVTYANLDGWVYEKGKNTKKGSSVLDTWMRSRSESTLEDITKSLDKYDTVGYVKTLQDFILDFSQWYVRRSRNRVGPTEENRIDKNACFQTLFDILVLTCKMIAPITPFIAEEMYRNLTGEESVHLSEWPEVNSSNIDKELEESMQATRQIVEKIHSKRKELKIPVRQPLSSCRVTGISCDVSDELKELLKDETNIKTIEFSKGEGELDAVLDTELTEGLKQEGSMREAIRSIQALRKEKGCALNEKVVITLPETLKTLSPTLLETVKKQTIASQVIWGTTFDVSIGK